MPAIKIHAPDGKSLLVRVPDGTSSDQFKQIAQSALAHYTGQTAKGPDLQQLQAEDKPLQNVSMSPLTQPDLDQAGEDIATSKFGQRNPNTAAALGTAVQMAPDIAMAASSLKPAAAIGEGGVDLVKTAAGVGRPGAEELAAARSALQGLPAKYAAKGQALDELAGQAGKEIEAAQTARGVGMTQTGVPEVPGDMNEFANSMLGIAKKSPDELAQSMDLKGLQQLKDTITVARQSGKMSSAESAMVSKAADAIDAAISKTAPDIGEGLGKFRTVKNSQGSLKNDMIVEKMKLQKAVQAIREDMRTNPATKVKKITGLIAKYAAMGAGLGGVEEGVRHLFK